MFGGAPLNPFFLFRPKSPQQTESPIAINARELAKKVGPRVYRLTSTSSRFILMGCGGDGKSNQQKVADKIYNDLKAEITKDPNNKPDYIFLLGDNFYDNGVDSPESLAFKKQLYDIYEKIFKEFGVKVIGILGNHDLNISEVSRYSATKGRSIGLNQRAHTLLPDGEKFKTSEEALDFLQTGSKPPKPNSIEEQQDMVIIDHEHMPVFFMPWNFFSIITDDNKQIFCLDSNVLCEDALYFETNKINPEDYGHPNQLKWLIDEYKKAKDAGRDVIIFTHHPMVHDSNDRHDTDHYLAPNQSSSLAHLYNTNDTTHTNLLNLTLDRHDIKGLHANAHNHFLEILANAANKKCQFTFGGAGGDLQSIQTLADHPNIKCHYDDYGYAILSGDTLDLRPLHQPRVIFNFKTYQFITDPAPDQEKQFAHKILTACDEYFFHLKQKELENKPKNDSAASAPASPADNNVEKQDPGILYNLKKTAAKVAHLGIKYFYSDPQKRKQIQIAYEMVGYFNQPTLTSLKEMTSFVSDKLKALDDLQIKEIHFTLHQFITRALGLAEPKFIAIKEDEVPSRPPSPRM